MTNLKKSLTVLGLLVTLVSCKSATTKTTDLKTCEKTRVERNINNQILQENVSYQTYFSNLGIKSILTVDEYYKKGDAHPMTKLSSVLYNQKNEVIEVSQILDKNAKAQITRQIEAEIKADKTGKYFKDQKVDLNKSTIVFAGNKVVILFPQYVLGPYSSGILKFEYNIK